MHSQPILVVGGDHEPGYVDGIVGQGAQGPHLAPDDLHPELRLEQAGLHEGLLLESEHYLLGGGALVELAHFPALVCFCFELLQDPSDAGIGFPLAVFGGAEQVYALLLGQEDQYVLEVLEVLLLGYLAKLVQLQNGKLLFPLYAQSGDESSDQHQIIKNIELGYIIESAGVDLVLQDSVLTHRLPEKLIQLGALGLVLEFLHQLVVEVVSLVEQVVTRANIVVVGMVVLLLLEQRYLFLIFLQEKHVLEEPVKRLLYAVFDAHDLLLTAPLLQLGPDRLLDLPHGLSMSAGQSLQQHRYFSMVAEVCAVDLVALCKFTKPSADHYGLLNPLASPGVDN